MPNLTSSNSFPAPYPLSEMVAAPLAGRLIGLQESDFVVAEWDDGGDPNAPSDKPLYIAPFHVHHSDDEAWYVLAGTLAFRLGDQLVEASAGTMVFAPRDTPHTYWNPTPNPTRYLLIMTPRIRDLIDAIHAATERDLASIQSLFERYNSTLIDMLF